MSEKKLSITDYVETCDEAAKRVRFTTIILVVITVLTLTGLLNSSSSHSWARNRLKFQQEYIRLLDLEISNPTIKNTDEYKNSLEKYSSQEVYKKESLLDQYINTPHPFKFKIPSCGNDICGFQCNENEVKKCYECARWRMEKEFENSIKSYTENVRVIKVPFFGVSFDINDLGLIGGFSIIIALVMLRLSLRSYIVSLRIGIKGAFNTKQHLDFYGIMASRQLFSFPYLEDKHQLPYKGETEKEWDNSLLKKSYIFLKNVTVYFINHIKISVIQKNFHTLINLGMNIKVDEKNISRDEGGLIKKIKKITKYFLELFIFFVWIANLIITIAYSFNFGVFKVVIFYIVFSLFCIICLAVHMKLLLPNERPRNFRLSEIEHFHWSVNPQPYLKAIPKIISLIPFFVYLLVVLNDYESIDAGLGVDKFRTVSGFALSVIQLIIIFGFGCWCISKWVEIDELWKVFKSKVDLFELNEIDPHQQFVTLFFPNTVDYDSVVTKLQSLKTLYKELAYLMKVSETDFPLQIKQLELGSLWLKIFGQSQVMKLLCQLIETSASFIFKNYTNEGQIKSIPEKVEAIKSILDLSEKLKVHGINTNKLNKKIENGSLIIAEELNKLIEGQKSIKINEKVIEIATDESKKLLENK